jgi:hypothetical protein
MQVCQHTWRTIPCGMEKCDSCGEQRLLAEPPRYIQPGVDAKPLTPGSLAGTSLGISENPSKG